MKHLLTSLLALGAAFVALAAPAAPDALVKQVSSEVVDAIRVERGRGGEVPIGKVITLVEAKVLPHINFQRMTASAIGRHWREATPQQRAQLQEEFKALLVRTYAGALSQLQEQTIYLRPLRMAADDTDVVVRTQVKGQGEPIQLDYRMEKTTTGWKIYDVNILGIWLVEQYRNSFAQEIGVNGVDGLIKRLTERNKAARA